MWLHSADVIARMRMEAQNEGRGAALSAPYDESCLASHYAKPPHSVPVTAAALAETALCTGRLPTVDCDGASALPPPARGAIEKEMACVLRRCGVFPAGLERWCRADFLRRELAQTSCHVLVGDRSRKRFKYWRDESNPAQQDRVPGGYAFRPPIRQEFMSGLAFFERSARAGSTECVYLQHTLLQGSGPGVQPAAGQAGGGGAGGLVPAGHFGAEMMRDLGQRLDHNFLSAVAQAGRFGAPARCQLFVGTAAAGGARTTMHYDQYDNIFLQLAGRKTFLLFDPLQSGRLGMYPIHHPLDRSCRVGLDAPLPAAGFARAGGAGGCRVTLEAGDVLVLPAYWWHEVLTEEGSELTVSLNFWFSPMHRMLQPRLPLSPMLRVELARQLEFLLCDALDDRVPLVAPFLVAFEAQLAAIADGRCDARAHALAARGAAHGAEGDGGGDALWAEAQACRPAGVDARAWAGLFEFVAAKTAHVLGGHAVLPFARDMLDPARFAGLERTDKSAVTK